MVKVQTVVIGTGASRGIVAKALNGIKNLD
jgi:hypothetical protein